MSKLCWLVSHSPYHSGLAQIHDIEWDILPIQFDLSALSLWIEDQRLSLDRTIGRTLQPPPDGVNPVQCGSPEFPTQADLFC